MSYKRKTKDVWEIQGLYNSSWETVTTEETRKDAISQLLCYDENEPQFPHRIRKTRTPISEKNEVKKNGTIQSTLQLPPDI